MAIKYDKILGQLRESDSEDGASYTTSDISEGSEFLYNQILGVTQSVHTARNDIGGVTYDYSSPSGYYKDLITNKYLFHTVLGVNTRTEDGALGYSNGRPFVYKDGAERDVLVGIDIQEESNKSISYEPFSSIHRFYIHSGDTLDIVNEVPVIQSYVNASMGAIPRQEVINGGTF